jgi:hypothetical protein
MDAEVIAMAVPCKFEYLRVQILGFIVKILTPLGL